MECGLLEPHPSSIPVLPEPGAPIPPRPDHVDRLAKCITYDTDNNATTEWVVKLTVKQGGRTTRARGSEGIVISWSPIENVQPSLDAFEYEEAERVVKVPGSLPASPPLPSAF